MCERELGLSGALAFSLPLFTEVPGRRFSKFELRLYGVLRSSPPEVAAWDTKIVHLGDAPST